MGSDIDNKIIKPLFLDVGYMYDAPGGECMRAFVDAMNRNVWDPIVYASDGAHSNRITPGFVRIIPRRFLVRYIAAVIRRILIPDLVNLPDYVWVSWGRNATKQVLKALRHGIVEPDYIHTVSFPSSCHWVGLKIKQKMDLPWVMQFYDPWADNPYRVFKTKWLKKYDWAMERKAVMEADMIIHNNDYIANLWRERYGEEIARKIFVLPLTIPVPKAKQIPLVKENKDVLVVSHIGNFMLNRRAMPFIEAVKELLSIHPEVRGRLKVNLVGSVVPEDKNLIDQYALKDVFQLHGSLTPEACEPIYQQSDMFLAVDGVNPENFFFPSKILKYFYFQRPILGITPKGSVLDIELKKSQHFVFDNSDIKLIANFLYQSISNYDSVCRFDKNYWERFKPSRVVEQYYEMIGALLNRK